MTFFIWILLLLFSLMIGLMVSIVFYHPNVASVEAKQVEPDAIKEEESDETIIDYTRAGQKMIQELHMRYPEMQIYMEENLLAHGVLLQWKGRQRTNSSYLLSLSQESCQNACMEAVQRIYDDCSIPQIGFSLVLPYHKSVENEASSECREYLRNHGIHMSGVVMDGSDNEYLLHQSRPQALIGVNTGSYLEIKVNGNPRKTQIWIDSIKPEELIPLHSNAIIRRIVASLEEEIPWMVRVELLAAPQKGLKDLLLLMPSAWVWMRASLEKRKDSLVLHAPDEVLLNEAYQILEEVASQNSFYLVKGTQIQHKPAVNPEDVVYRRLSKAIQTSFEVKGIVPVSVGETGKLGQYEGWKTCRYAPLIENKKESPESAILFYQSFFTEA